MRQSLRLATLLWLLSGFFSTAAAQSVEEIVAKNIEAKGGHATLRGTQSVRTTARGTMRGQSATVVSASERPHMMRNEITLEEPASGTAALPGGPRKLVYGFDGDTAWLKVGDGPAQPLPAGPQTEAQKSASQIDSPLLDYKAKGTTVVLGEPVTEDGKRLHHLIVTPKGAPSMHYYIDPATNLETKMVIEVDERGQQVRMEMRFDDYRRVDGRMVPFSVTQLVNGAPYMHLTFEKIEFNVPIDDQIFRMPR